MVGMENIKDTTETSDNSIIGLIPEVDEIVQGTNDGIQIELRRGDFEKNDIITDALTVGIEGYPRLRFHALGHAVLKYGNAISTRIRLDDHNHKDMLVFSVANIPCPDPEPCV